jgi:hypothetical protein
LKPKGMAAGVTAVTPHRNGVFDPSGPSDVLSKQ